MFLSFIFLTMPQFAHAAPQSLSYQGRILDSLGDPLENSSVVFRFTLLSPDGICELWTEDKAPLNMTNSGGIFDLTIGPSAGLATALENGTNHTCINSGNYTGIATAGRLLKVEFNPGNTGWKTITPNLSVNSVPYAAVAAKLGNMTAGDFIARPGTCSTGQSVYFDGTNFVCQSLVAGDIPNIDAAKITSGTIVRDVSSTNVSATNGQFTNLRIYDGVSQYITMTYPSAGAASYTVRWPATQGAASTVLQNDGAGNLSWAAAGSGSGDITEVVAGAGLTGGATTGIATLAVDSGLGANKIPVVGGIALGANGVVVANGLGTALSSLNCTLGQVIKFNVSGFATCGSDSDTGSGSFSNGGNSFGAAATLGTNDAFALNFETSGTPKMTVLPSGLVGIGTVNPLAHLTVRSPAGDVGSINLEFGNFTHSLGQDSWSGSLNSVLEITGLHQSQGGAVVTGYGNSGGSALMLRGAVNTATPTNAPTVISGGKWNGSATTTNIGATEKLVEIQNNDLTPYMTVMGSGNVGIGNTNPGARLELGTAGTSLGTLRLAGNTSGYVQLQAAAAAGSWNITLPSGPGTNGQVLSTNGSGVTSWTTIAGGSGDVTQGGNSFTAPMTIGTNDAQPLSLETGGTTKVSILQNGDVGIGTAAPTESLHISTTDQYGGIRVDRDSNADFATANLRLYSFSNSYQGFGGAVTGISARGTKALPTATQSGDTLLRVSGNGWGTTSERAGASIGMLANGNWTDSSSPTYMAFSTTEATGSITERMRITDAGNVGIGSLFGIPNTIPGARLDVQDGSASGAITIKGYQYFGNGYGIYGHNSGSYDGWLGAGVGGIGIVGVRALYSGTNEGGSALIAQTSTATTSGNLIRVQHQASTYSDTAFLADMANGSGTFTGNFLDFRNAGSSRMVVTSSGNVGIGTTNPLSKLDSRSNSGINTIISGGHGMNSYGSFIGASSRGTEAAPTASQASDVLGVFGALGYGTSAYPTLSKGGMTVSASQSWTNAAQGTQLSFYTTPNGSNAAQDRLVILNNGNVGVGTVTPSFVLHAQRNQNSATYLTVENSNTGASSLAGYVGNSSGGSVAMGSLSSGYSVDGAYLPSGGFISFSGPSGLALISQAPAGNFRFYTAGAATGDEKMRISSNGNVGIGNTAPGRLLHVGSASVGTGLAVANFQNVDGTCTITPASSGSGIACSSDERLKENFQEVTGAFALDRILKLQAVTYNFKTSSIENRRTGYKAQEVQKVAPEFVRENDDGLLQVYYDAFIPWITEAIKTLHSRIAGVENRQVAQEQKLESQGRQIASKADKIEVDTKIQRLEIENDKLKQENAAIKARLEKIEKALGAK